MKFKSVKNIAMFSFSFTYILCKANEPWIFLLKEYGSEIHVNKGHHNHNHNHNHNVNYAYNNSCGRFGCYGMMS